MQREISIKNRMFHVKHLKAIKQNTSNKAVSQDETIWIVPRETLANKSFSDSAGRENSLHGQSKKLNTPDVQMKLFDASKIKHNYRRQKKI
jgi:hypothetical protein